MSSTFVQLHFCVNALKNSSNFFVLLSRMLGAYFFLWWNSKKQFIFSRFCEKVSPPNLHLIVSFILKIPHVLNHIQQVGLVWELIEQIDRVANLPNSKGEGFVGNEYCKWRKSYGQLNRVVFAKLTVWKHWMLHFCWWGIIKIAMVGGSFTNQLWFQWAQSTC